MCIDDDDDMNGTGELAEFVDIVSDAFSNEFSGRSGPLICNDDWKFRKREHLVKAPFRLDLNRADKLVGN